MATPGESVRGERSPHVLKQRYTRTRNGCERCRGQRRKCDEGKPRCKRCVVADAVCKYHITPVSFKDKNSYTSTNDVSSTLPEDSTSLGTYSTITVCLLFISNDKTNGQKLSGNSSHSSKGALQSSPSLDSGWPLVGRSPLSSAEVELLKYYNYHIAPWLDVYDQDHTFGHHVTMLAMNSPCILELLLQLSAVFSSRPVEIVTRRGAGLFHLQAMSNPPGIDSPSSALRNISCFVLARTILFVESIPDSWEPSFRGGGALLYFRKFDFLDSAQRQMWFAFLTLILRLEIACCLMNHAAPIWVHELACQIQKASTKNSTENDKAQQVLNASISCLKLLVDVMRFSFPSLENNNPSTATSATNPSRIDEWNKLAGELCAWYRSRHPILEPLVDVENSENGFPTVIFASGAGISCEILYNTAILLLLDNNPDPETLDKQIGDSAVDGVQMPPRWHIERICGIAINSEPEHSNCWDPASIAAFSYAARRIRYNSQQNTIRIFLSRLKVSGWHVDGLIDKLHNEWTSDNPYGSQTKS
ncbi:hypothetical protein F4678DRAFT_471119 [Xylaria arbuscula]|nr:hypothetical protein F4678DRAFT_471119 [Xylaria arbuscula]